MKHALLATLLLSILPVAAQQEVTPVRLNEQREVQAATTDLLTRAMVISPTGIARTTHQLGSFENRIEMKGLKIVDVVKLPLSDSDRQQGISRRYHAKVNCAAHRIWDGPRVAWSEWRASNYGFLPSTIVVEEINGQLQARASRLKNFTPGIDASLAVFTR
ncbi:hypothetical protein [Luteolibacter marinus]|uniref:hypothetical protein n=1 Tax=Luteolibacter marinus TaxID=2776705 RepID=UPI00186750C4|nr:hypothetical protein [Luteolibacter marinus]